MDINAFDLAVAAVVLPPIIALINQSRWPAQLKGIIALIVCLVYSLGIEAFRGPIDFQDWRETGLTVAGGAFAAHKLWWQPSGIGPAIEAMTSASGGGGHRADTTPGEAG